MMNRLLIVAVLLAVLGLAVAGPAMAQQERQEITVLIPLKYMSAATAAQIFGGTVISPMPVYGQNAFGARNIGHQYGRNNYHNGNYGSRNFGNTNYGWGSYQSGQNVGGYGSPSLDLGRSFWR